MCLNSMCAMQYLLSKFRCNCSCKCFSLVVSKKIPEGTNDKKAFKRASYARACVVDFRTNLLLFNGQKQHEQGSVTFIPCLQHCYETIMLRLLSSSLLLTATAHRPFVKRTSDLERARDPAPSNSSHALEVKHVRAVSSAPRRRTNFRELSSGALPRLPCLETSGTNPPPRRLILATVPRAISATLLGKRLCPLMLLLLVCNKTRHLRGAAPCAPLCVPLVNRQSHQEARAVEQGDIALWIT